ncbi:MAG: ferrous iron transporter B, partial [Actinomycetia bacterium]|nr:ferrous iron transporter B [Actinomycetes bacterium]
LPMILGLGCGAMATLTTRILDTKRERIIATLLLALGIPCSAQLGVIIGLLGGISPQALLLFFVIIAFQLLLVGYLASKIIPGEVSDFIIEIPPFRAPLLTNLLVKTIYRIEWYVKEAVPFFLFGTALLFFLDITGILEVLKIIGKPVILGWLNLPVETTESFILGFLRRDYGAAGLYALAGKGILSNTQAFISLVVITLFVPCVANFLIIIKERGIKMALAMVGFIFPFAFFVGGVLNLIFKGLGVVL